MGYLHVTGKLGCFTSSFAMLSSQWVNCQPRDSSIDLAAAFDSVNCLHLGAVEQVAGVADMFMDSLAP